MTVATPNSWRALNDAALHNLDAWVPALNLPRTRKRGGKYEMVAGFRPSRKAGLADAKRPRALTIDRRGICDHADGDRGYSPIDLVAATFGLEPRAAKDWLVAALGGDVAIDDRPTTAVATVESSRSSAKLGAIARLWVSCVPIVGTPAEAYLAGRGLCYDGTALRFRPTGCTMAAAITDAITGELVGVQQTYLTLDGGAVRGTDGKKVKLTTGYGAGVVRLTADEDVSDGLAIAEGVETALAAPFRPIWACLVANNVAHFPVLSGIASLTIFADNDASGTGLRVARQCAERWHRAGREVTIRMLDQVGLDYADVVSEAA